jgi:hypothetical protein
MSPVSAKKIAPGRLRNVPKITHGREYGDRNVTGLIGCPTSWFNRWAPKFGVCRDIRLERKQEGVVKFLVQTEAVES